MSHKIGRQRCLKEVSEKKPVNQLKLKSLQTLNLVGLYFTNKNAIKYQFSWKFNGE